MNYGTLKTSAAKPPLQADDGYAYDAEGNMVLQAGPDGYPLCTLALAVHRYNQFDALLTAYEDTLRSLGECSDADHGDLMRAEKAIAEARRLAP